MVTHAFNPRTREANAGGSLRVPGQPDLLHRETCLERKKEFLMENSVYLDL